jgi:hypothetical protein
MEKTGFFLNNKCFFIPSDDTFLLMLLNSGCFWFQLISLARLKRGGYIEAEAQYIDQLCVPETASKSIKAAGTKLGTFCIAATKRRSDVQSVFHHRLLDDLAPPEHQKLTSKLEYFWTLDFAAFRAEVKKAFKTEIPVKDRDGWEKYLAEKSSEVIALTAQIGSAEREIDAIVYKLFDLTPDEIKLLEASLEGQY